MRHIRVKVTAGARREKIAEKGGTLEIFVKEEAQGNMANRRVVQLVAAQLKVAPSRVRIVAGHHSPRKTLAITE